MGISNISLAAGMYKSLLALNDTSAKIDRTQERLSTGKKVNSALDNPTNFFASQAALNRALDLSSRKDGISEAIQNGEAANAGLTAITSLINSAKGLASSAHSASAGDRASLASQFNGVLAQIDSLAGDSGYRGTNLLKNDDLTINFNENGSSNLTITGVDATSGALGIEPAALGTDGPTTNIGIGHVPGIAWTTVTYSGPAVPYAGTFSLTVNVPPGVDLTPTSLADQDQLNHFGGHLVKDVAGFGWGNNIVSVIGDSSAFTITATNSTDDPFWVNPTVNNGDSFVVQIFPGGLERTFKTGMNPTTISSVIVNGVDQSGNYSINSIGDIVFSQGQAPTVGQVVAIKSSSTLWATDDLVSTSENQLETALSTLRTNSKTLSSSLSVVAVRQDFTQQMISTLQTGSDNLTLADMNQEGANMLMLQTRQSLGTTSLSMASQASQSVMRLF